MIRFTQPRLRIVFYRTAAGAEPVRDWLHALSRTERKIVGEDLKTVQFGWPLGMPLVRPLGDGLFEVRSQLRGRTARLVFLTVGGLLILLHAFIKKSQRILQKELELARSRAATMTKEER